MTRDKKWTGSDITAFTVWTIAGLFTYAWALAVLWRWFVAEPFAVRTIGMVHAYGLALLVRLVSERWVSLTERRETPASDQISNSIANAFVPLFMLGCGWLVHWWMLR